MVKHVWYVDKFNTKLDLGRYIHMVIYMFKYVVCLNKLGQVELKTAEAYSYWRGCPVGKWTLQSKMMEGKAYIIFW